MPSAAIALGGNLGPVVRNFQVAAQRLVREGSAINRASALYRTSAVGDKSCTGYLNGAILITTESAPHELLRSLLEIEAATGRQRTAEWSPRPLDLDLIWYDDLVLESDNLTLPHPACWYRRFVLDPLADVCPEWIHPLKGTSVRELQARLQSRPLHVGLAGGERRQRERLTEAAQPFAPLFQVDDWPPPGSQTDSTAGLTPAVIAWLGPSDPSDWPAPGAPKVARPQSECRHAEFLVLPASRRLDVSRLACQGDLWLDHLRQALTDQPRQIASSCL